jgi:cob(I)alamin adenosyltransferase
MGFNRNGTSGEKGRGERLKIYTKGGDGGETGLFGGGRVPKDDLRVDAYGQVDELNAALGLALALEPRTFCRDLLEGVQRDLFTIGAELATPDPVKLAKALGGPPVGPAQILALEQEIDRHDAEVPPLKQFILPGGVAKAAALQLARTICRRAERAVVRLHRDQTGGLSSAVPYLNRLSDLLFVLARVANHAAGGPELTW